MEKKHTTRNSLLPLEKFWTGRLWWPYSHLSEDLMLSSFYSTTFFPKYELESIKWGMNIELALLSSSLGIPHHILQLTILLISVNYCCDQITCGIKIISIFSIPKEGNSSNRLRKGRIYHSLMFTMCQTY